MWAARALGQIGDEAAFKALLRASKERDSQVRKRADTGLIYPEMAVKDEELKGTIKMARDEFAKTNNA
ncbi:MAG TPA: hypothetical protein PKX40_20100 [Spirochaetota bacterium]|nr:hypothetical protein [Spirochaetota bacterium]